jgi:hypothetical protein
MTDGTTTDLARRRAHTEPLVFIAEQLTRHARGEPVDEDLMMETATLVAAAQLVKAGASLDAVERQFRDRDHSFRFAWEPDEDTGEPSLVVEVVWDDDEADPDTEGRALIHVTPDIPDSEESS